MTNAGGLFTDWPSKLAARKAIRVRPANVRNIFGSPESIDTRNSLAVQTDGQISPKRLQFSPPDSPRLKAGQWKLLEKLIERAGDVGAIAASDSSEQIRIQTLSRDLKNAAHVFQV